MNTKKKTIVVLVVFGIAITALYVGSFKVSVSSNLNINTTIDNRPIHCLDRNCVESAVFAELPAYPEDFNDKWLAVYYGRLSNLSWIETKYWKQPEFYADSFNTQWLQYYVGNSSMSFVAGSGPYPGDVVVTATPGESFPIETFWHAGPVNIKKQLFGFTHDFPDNMNIRIGDIKVAQSPAEAAECISIDIKPKWVLLDTTLPRFGYNWTQKVNAKISIAEDCKPGWYGLEIVQAEVPSDIRERIEFEYGVTKIASILAGGSWQVFIHVVD